MKPSCFHGKCVPVTNIETILTDYAWKRYLQYLGRPKKYFVKKEKHGFLFHWGSLDFAHQTTISQTDPENNLLGSVDFRSPKPETKVERSRKRNKSHSYISVNSDVGEPVTLGCAKYKNRRNKTKIYKFCTQQETPVSVTVKLRECYTLGERTNIVLTLPQKLMPGDRSEHQISVTEVKKQTFKNTYKWRVDSDVAVKACHQAEVTCVAHEQEMSGEFEVKTRLSLVRDYFPIVIQRKSDSKVLYTCFITNLEEVFRDHTQRNISSAETTQSDRPCCNVILTSRGKFKAMGWREYDMIVTSEPIQQYRANINHVDN